MEKVHKLHNSEYKPSSESFSILFVPSGLPSFRAVDHFTCFLWPIRNNYLPVRDTRVHKCAALNHIILSFDTVKYNKYENNFKLYFITAVIAKHFAHTVTHATGNIILQKIT